MNTLGMAQEGKSTYFSVDVLWFLEIYQSKLLTVSLQSLTGVELITCPLKTVDWQSQARLNKCYYQTY